MSFFTQMVVGQYVPGDSMVHRLNPFMKVCLTLLLTTYLFVFTSGAQYSSFIAFAGLTFLSTGLGFGFFLRGLRPILFLIFLTFIIHVFLTPSESRIEVYGGWTLPREGFLRGAHFAGRLVLLVTMTTILTLTTSTVELTFAIERLVKPLARFGFPAAEFAMMLTIALRFIPVLFLELDRIMKAQKARGVRFDQGRLKDRVQDMLSILIPLFVNTFQRAFDLAAAMEIRCYEAGRVRGQLRQYPFAVRDGLAIGVVLTFSAWLIHLDPRFLGPGSI